MRVSNKLMADNILANLRRQTNQLLETQTRILTGKVINKPSDDPIGMGKVLDYRQTLASIDQFDINITNGKSRIEYTENILDSVHDLVSDAKRIAADNNPDSQGALAQEVEDIRSQILQLANSMYDGTYVFSGDATDTKPFDSSGTYVGSPTGGTKEFMIAPNVEVSVQADGSDIFQGVEDVFTVMDDLKTALQAGDETAIANQIKPLQDVLDHLELTRSDNAAKYRRLEMSEAHWSSFKIGIQNLLSKTEDADMAAEVINLQIQQASYQTSLATSAKIVQPTLMQFLS
jgi:flagellar hook-associated protein 3 FlgL